MSTPELAVDRVGVGGPRAVLARLLVGGWWVGALAVLVGVGLLLVGTVGMDRVTAWPRWVLGLAGLAVVFKGLDRLAKAAFGPGFKTGLWLAGVWVGVLVVAAVLAPVLPLERPHYLPLTAPSYVRPDLFSAHPLGTDGFGRDYLSRVIYGARVSLVVGLGCTAIGVAVGGAIGVVAGYFRGRAEAVVDVLTDSVLAFPPLVFLLALVAVLRPSLQTLIIALALLTIPTIVRLAKANTYRYAQREFVLAARALGAMDRRILRREIVPNVAVPLFSYAMVIVAALIVAEASLSFLGLGIKAPDPSWGNMIAESQTVIQQNPHAVLVPAGVLFITVFAFNRLGEAGRARRESRQAAI